MHAHLCTETRSWTTFNGYSSDGLKCWLWDPVFNVTLCKGWDKVHYSLDGCMLCVKCYCTHDTLCVINTDTVWIGRMLFVDIVWLDLIQLWICEGLTLCTSVKLCEQLIVKCNSNVQMVTSASMNIDLWCKHFLFL